MKKIIAVCTTLVAIFTIFFTFNTSITANKETSSASLDVQNSISNNDIYPTVQIDANYSIPLDAQSILNASSNIFEAKITKVGKPYFQNQTDPYPLTPIQLDIIKQYKGTIQNSSITLDIPGGNIIISDLLNQINEERIAKMNLDDLSEEDKNTKYISYQLETDFDYKEEDKLLFAANYEKETDSYLLSLGGYSVFTINGDETFNNILTDEVINQDNF